MRILWLEDNPEDLQYFWDNLRELAHLEIVSTPLVSEFFSLLEREYNKYNMFIIDVIIRTITKDESKAWLGDDNIKQEEVGLEVVKRLVSIMENKPDKKPILVVTVLSDTTIFGKYIIDEIKKLKQYYSQKGITIEIFEKRYGANVLKRKIDDLGKSAL